MTDNKVPSFAVTNEQLAEWGFPVEVRGHIVGSSFIEQAGMRRADAVIAAWHAGHVRIASDRQVVEAFINGCKSWAEAKGHKVPKADPAMIAWAEANKAQFN